MSPNDPVDDFQVPWDSFADFFWSRGDEGTYLIELSGAAGERREWTSGEWKALVARTAHAIAAKGVEPGDSLAALIGNRAESLALAFACWSSGVCYVPLSGSDTVERQQFIVADSGATLVIAPESDHANLAASSGLAASTYEDLVRGVDSTDRPAGPRASLDVAALQVYTSGTTGVPKSVILSSRNLLVDCDALARASGWDESTRALTVLPIHHVNGLVVSSLQTWFVGASTVLCDRFRSDRFWADAKNESATVSSLVPSLLEFLLASGGLAPEGFEVFCGAGPLLTETVLAFESQFGVPVRHLFGMSETTAVVTMMPRLSDAERTMWHADWHFPSIGTPVPHVKVAILDQAGRELPAGERGEIAVRGAMVGAQQTGVPGPEGVNWLLTGDEGFWQPGPDARRFYFLTGRLKEVIIRGGVNISPLEVDAAIRSHPLVTFGLAVPFQNRYYGDEIAAYVVTDTPSLTARDIIDHCRGELDFAKSPKVVIFGSDVPYTATGKAKRLELARRLADELNEFRDVQFRKADA